MPASVPARPDPAPSSTVPASTVPPDPVPPEPAGPVDPGVLARLGAAPPTLRALADFGNPGRVVRAERSGARVLTAAGGRHVPYADVAVGDWVDLVAGVVGRVLPRHTAIVRTDPGGRSTPQILAANVDTVLICTPASADPPVRRLERLLALAWSSGAAPVVVATKADLYAGSRATADLDTVDRNTVERNTLDLDTVDLDTVDLEPLRRCAPGVPVLPTTPRDVRALTPYLGPGRTLALLGASGVGKSTLANALLGSDALETATVRRDGKGRHRTSWRELVVLPGGGALIDTPGLRGVGLSPGDADGVAATFADVADLAVDCRFRDCAHGGEPGCAVVGAVDAGVLDPRRVAAAARLEREMAWQAAKGDARLRAERNRRWRQATREYRARGGR